MSWEYEGEGRKGEGIGVPILGSGGRDPHRSVTAVHSLHLDEGALLVVLVGETNEAVAATLAGHGIGHDLSRLARRESSLEERDQDVFIDLRTKIADEDAELGAAIVTVRGRY